MVSYLPVGMFTDTILADGVITYSVDATMYPFDGYIDQYLSSLSAALGVEFVEVMPDYQYGGKKGEFIESEAEFRIFGERSREVGGTYELSEFNDVVVLAVNKDAGGPAVREFLEQGIVEALGGDVYDLPDSLTGLYGPNNNNTFGSYFDGDLIFEFVRKGAGARLNYKLNDPSEAPV